MVSHLLVFRNGQWLAVDHGNMAKEVPAWKWTPASWLIAAPTHGASTALQLWPPLHITAVPRQQSISDIAVNNHHRYTFYQHQSLSRGLFHHPARSLDFTLG